MPVAVRLQMFRGSIPVKTVSSASGMNPASISAGIMAAPQIPVEAADPDAHIGPGEPVDRHSAPRAREQFEACGIVEVDTRDVKGFVPLQLDPFEGVEGEIAAGDRRGDLGGARFETSTVRRHDRDRGFPIQDRADVVAPLTLAAGEFREARVTIPGGFRGSTEEPTDHLESRSIISRE